jgi:hypothetical protein
MNTTLTKSCLNVEVSAWANYFETEHPRNINLLTWLHSAKYAQQVEAIRAAATKEERDKLKATLPAITPSGIFSRREGAGLIRHSGFIQIDIDLKDNWHIGNYAELKAQLSKLQNITYLGLSVSGTGFWGLVPILYPHKHKQHFQALKSAFLKMGIRIDDKPGNVASLRGYSYDNEAYFNHSAKPFTLLVESQPEQCQYKAAGTRVQRNEAEKVEAILQQAEAGRIDITKGITNWFKIGLGLAAEFGESGRGYFHRASQFHTDYRAGKCDAEYSRCLAKYSRTSVTLASFFDIAKDYGLTWKQRLHSSSQALLARPKAIQPSQKENQAPQEEQAPQEQAPQQEAPQALPEGIQVVSINRGQVLEVDGLPWGWLNEVEQEAARARLAGHELEVMTAINPAVTALVERLGLAVE